MKSQTFSISLVCSDTVNGFSTFYIYDIVYSKQNADNWCGPASLIMVLNFWGTELSQEEVADEIYDPTTNLTDISDMQSYPQRYGFETEVLDGSIIILKEWISRGCPLIVLQRNSLINEHGHFRAIIGYDDNEGQIMTFDPIYGKNYNITYADFIELWKPASDFTVENWTLVIVPQDSYLVGLMENYQLSLNQEDSTNGQFVSPENFYLIVSMVALILGAIGGIPQILRWFEAKPRLRIVDVKIGKYWQSKEEKNAIGLGYDVVIENEKKFWGRNRDATKVEAEVYVTDKNHFQLGTTVNKSITPYLMAGMKIYKELSSTYMFNREGNPHTILLLVKCQEEVIKKKAISYKVEF